MAVRCPNEKSSCIFLIDIFCNNFISLWKNRSGLHDMDLRTLKKIESISEINILFLIKNKSISAFKSNIFRVEPYFGNGIHKFSKSSVSIFY